MYSEYEHNEKQNYGRHASPVTMKSSLQSNYGDHTFKPSPRDDFSYRTHATHLTTPSSTASREYHLPGHANELDGRPVRRNETRTRSASDHTPYYYRTQGSVLQGPLMAQNNNASFRSSAGESVISCLSNSDKDFGVDYLSNQDTSSCREEDSVQRSLSSSRASKAHSRPQANLDDDQSVSPPSIPDLAETDQNSFTYLDLDAHNTPTLPRDLSNEDLENLSQVVTNHLSYNFENELSFRFADSEYSSNDECSIEVAPQVYKPLRGADCTWDAIRMGTIFPTICIPCNIHILTIETVQYVVCPTCRIVSGANESGEDDAVGLGFTFEDLDEWRREIKSACGVNDNVVV